MAGLNFPVRNGEGWNPRAMTALLLLLYVSGTLAPPPRRPPDVVLKKSLIGSKLTVESVFFLSPPDSPCGKPAALKAFGQLVLLGFAITDFTPAAYRRRRLRRPCMEILS